MWLELSHFVCFPFIQTGLHTNTGFFFSAHRMDCQLAEFDKDCIGLESLTASLTWFIGKATRT